MGARYTVAGGAARAGRGKHGRTVAVRGAGDGSHQVERLPGQLPGLPAGSGSVSASRGVGAFTFAGIRRATRAYSGGEILTGATGMVGKASSLAEVAQATINAATLGVLVLQEQGALRRRLREAPLRELDPGSIRPHARRRRS